MTNSRLRGDGNVAEEEKSRPTKYGMDAITRPSKVSGDEVLGEDALVNKPKKKVSLDSVLRKGEMTVTIIKGSNTNALAALVQKITGEG